jgi:hypothetical protein
MWDEPKWDSGRPGTPFKALAFGKSAHLCLNSFLPLYMHAPFCDLSMDVEKPGSCDQMNVVRDPFDRIFTSNKTIIIMTGAFTWT